MVYFRKRLTPEILGEINEMIVRDTEKRQAKETESGDDDDSGDTPGSGGNRGTVIVDAACAPSDIRYPQDVSLLNEARENAEKLLDVLLDPADGKKPRIYRKRTWKDYLKYTRCRKHIVRMTRKAIGKQLTYFRRDLDAIDGKLSPGKFLTARQTERLDTIRTIYEQQKYMYDNPTQSGAPVRHRDGPGRVEPKTGFGITGMSASVWKRNAGSVRRSANAAMGPVTAKLRQTAAHVTALSVPAPNLRKIQCAVLQLLAYLRAIFSPRDNWPSFSRH